jgi:hypothetical protein
VSGGLGQASKLSGWRAKERKFDLSFINFLFTRVAVIAFPGSFLKILDYPGLQSD